MSDDRNTASSTTGSTRTGWGDYPAPAASHPMPTAVVSPGPLQKLEAARVGEPARAADEPLKEFVPMEASQCPFAVMCSAKFLDLHHRAGRLNPPLRLLVRIVFSYQSHAALVRRSRGASDPQITKAVQDLSHEKFSLRPAHTVPRLAFKPNSFVAFCPQQGDDEFERDFEDLDHVASWLSLRELSPAAAAKAESLHFTTNYCYLIDAPVVAVDLARPAPAPAAAVAAPAAPSEDIVERNEQGDVVRVVHRPLSAGGQRNLTGAVGAIKDAHLSGGKPLRQS